MFSLGTVSCDVCGSLFPLTTSVTRGGPDCAVCGTPCPGASPASTSAALSSPVFSQHELELAEKAVRQRLRAAKASAAGVTEVDNRVLEETFCEQCKRHTPCRSFARQTRSADEGQTIFFQCTICKSEWQQNS